MSIFYFLLREIEIWLQKQIKRGLFRVKNLRFSSGYGYLKKIKISHHLAFIAVFSLLSVFRTLPVIVQVSNYPQYTHQTSHTTCQKPFGSVFNLWPIKWSSVVGYLKKTTSDLPYRNAFIKFIFFAGWLFSGLFLVPQVLSITHILLNPYHY